MSIALPDFFNTFVKIIVQDQENDVCDSVIVLKGQEDIDQVCKLFVFSHWKKRIIIHVLRHKIEHCKKSLHLILLQKNFLMFQAHLHLRMMELLSLLCQTLISKINVFTCFPNVICNAWINSPENLSKMFSQKRIIIKLRFDFFIFLVLIILIP